VDRQLDVKRSFQQSSISVSTIQLRVVCLGLTLVLCIFVDSRADVKLHQIDSILMLEHGSCSRELMSCWNKRKFCRGCVFGPVCVFVCLSVCEQDYCKSNEPISLKLGVMIGSTNRKKCLTFGGDPLPDTESRSLSISINVAESGILGD